MNWMQAQKIADAVLYEGYLLYPYRPSAIKNRQRFNFGVLYPRDYSERQKGSDPWMMKTECLVRSAAAPVIHIKVRCLQLSSRTVRECPAPPREVSARDDEDGRPVERLVVEGKVFLPWQEAVEHEILIAISRVGDTIQQVTREFRFPAAQTREEVRDAQGKRAGVIFREQRGVEGAVDLSVSPLEDGLSRVSVAIRNTSQCGSSTDNREAVLAHSMLSTHTILGVEGGGFVSLLEPPQGVAASVAECQNVNTWPVLVGEQGSTDVMLSSPIILYDYPQIAPESPGDLFDGTEIDEILTLRIITMTEEEKQEVREADPRGKALLERTETLPPEHLMKLHGVLRGLRPSQEKAS